MSFYSKNINVYSNKTGGFTQHIGGYGKKGAFMPEFKVARHKNEFTFDISFFKDNQFNSDANFTKDKNNKFIFNNGKSKANIYPVDNKFGEGSSIEFEIEFDELKEFLKFAKEKDGFYEVEFQVQSQGLVWIWQPAESEESTEEGETISRPDNVEGSFALYFDGKRDNQYKCGKFGHVYAFYLVDKNGKKYKVELRADSYSAIKSTLTAYIKKELIEAVEFPIKIDPEFGCTDIGSTVYNFNGSSIGYRVYINSGVTLRRLFTYCSNTGSYSHKQALYLAATYPVSCYDSGETTGLSGAGWVSVGINYTTVTDQYYALEAMQSDGYFRGVYDSGTTANRYYYNYETYENFPFTDSQGLSGNYRIFSQFGTTEDGSAPAIFPRCGVTSCFNPHY